MDALKDQQDHSAMFPQTLQGKIIAGIVGVLGFPGLVLVVGYAGSAYVVKPMVEKVSQDMRESLRDTRKDFNESLKTIIDAWDKKDQAHEARFDRLIAALDAKDARICDRLETLNDTIGQKGDEANAILKTALGLRLGVKAE